MDMAVQCTVIKGVPGRKFERNNGEFPSAKLYIK
jgi:hypothetical protein